MAIARRKHASNLGLRGPLRLTLFKPTSSDVKNYHAESCILKKECDGSFLTRGRNINQWTPIRGSHGNFETQLIHFHTAPQASGPVTSSFTLKGIITTLCFKSYAQMRSVKYPPGSAEKLLHKKHICRSIVAQ